MKETFILSAKRTPIGGFLGTLSDLTAPELGSHAIQAAIRDSRIEPSVIDSVYMGNVLSANLGQSPARQAAKFGGVPDATDATTINKVCASGMKAIMIGAQQIQLGLEKVVIAGGMESMSNVPHYSLLRKPHKPGDSMMIDGLLKDGLTDVYHGFHMGNATELTVKKYALTREQQDEYAISSYEKAAMAVTQSKFEREIVALELTRKNKREKITTDEDVAKLIPEKVPLLKPSFQPDGTITAANSSGLNDGAAAVVLASREVVRKYGLRPMAKLIAYADAAQEPAFFATSPALAINKALRHSGLRPGDIDFFEINEAYAAVVLANKQILDLDITKINVYGGAIALGHPLGASGARIITTLLSVLEQEGRKYGVAAICNGGGAASAVLIENLQYYRL